MIDSFPMYCGGRLLKGLYNYTGHCNDAVVLEFILKTAYDTANPGKAAEWSYDPYKATNKITGKQLFKTRPWTDIALPIPSTGGKTDPFYWVPNDLITFQYALGFLTNYFYYRNYYTKGDGKGMNWNKNIGIANIYAVTNASQTIAAKHLENTGFKLITHNDKSSPGHGYGCKNWWGEWWEIVKILDKLPMYEFDKEEAKPVVTEVKTRFANPTSTAPKPYVPQQVIRTYDFLNSRF